MYGKSTCAVLLLVILSAVTYLNVLSNAFVFDDVYVISGNYFIRDWKNFWGLFTHRYFAASGELSYRPVVTLSYFIDYSLWRLNPLGYHLANVALHTLNAALLFFFVRRMAGNTPVACLSSAFFVCHPVLSEAVNAVSYREDLLAATFFITALMLYVRTQSLNKFYLYPLSLLSYLLALFSKEMAITLPLLIVLFDGIILRGGSQGGADAGCFRVNAATGSGRSFTKRIVRFYPGYVLVTVFYLLVRFWWLHNPAESGVSYPQENHWFNFLVMLKVAASYLRLLFFPVHLNADYLVPAVSSTWGMSCILSLLLIVSVGVIACRLFFHARLLFFSVVWFFVALMPVLNVVPIGNIMAERYLYIPVIGMCIMGGCLVTALRRSSSFAHILFYPLTAVILLGFAWQGASRSGDWKDEFTLWSKTIVREPASYKAHSSLGILLIRRGFEQEGMAGLQKSLSLNPSYPDAHNNMGTLYEQKGMYTDAVKEYVRALSINQTLPEAHYNLGNVYLKMNRYDKAVAEYRLYLSGKGDHPAVYYNLGVACMKLGMLDESVMAFQKSLQNNPGNADCYNNLGVIYARKGRPDDAISAFREALQYNAAHPDALRNLASMAKAP